MTYEQLHEEVCDAILNKSQVKYGALNQFTITPHDSNDLDDKVYSHKGELLTAYINGDNERILAIMTKLCAQEIDSLVDLIGD